MRIGLVCLAVSFLAAAGCGGGGAGATGSGGGGGGGGSGGEVRRTFVVPHVLETSGRITGVATADLDGDGVPDLVTFNAATSSLDIQLSTKLRESPTLASTGKTRLARGDGAHEGSQHVFVWDSTADLCVGDVNGDGRPDLVVAGGSSRAVGVWGSAPGDVWAIGAPIIMDVPISCDRVALGDVDEDCDCDIVCLDESTGQLKILLQTPGLTPPFVVGNDPPAVGACRGLVVLDMNRDGHMDVVTNRFGADAMCIWELDAASGILSPRDVASGLPTGKAMGIGDLDGDGWPDAVLVREDGRALVSLHQRSAQAGFFDVFISDLAIAVNEEGVQVAQISIDEPGLHVHVRESPTRQSLRESPSRPSLGKTLRLGMTQPGIGLCDFDRDGHLDVLISPAGGDPDFDLLMIYGIRESPTRFSSMERARDPATGQASGKRQHCAIADLDCDGHPDMVIGDPDFDLLRLIYTGDPSPTAPDFQELLRESPSKASTGATMVDIDRDGRLDVVTATNAGIDVRFQDAFGRFSQPTTLGGAQSFVCVAAGDVNGDGCVDLLAATQQTCAAILRDPANARSFFAPIPLIPVPGGNFRSLALADVDCDGHVDCVAIRESPSKASLGRGQGNGFFDVFTEIDVGVTSPMSVAVGDLNGDGRPDLAVCGTDSSSVTLQDPAAPGSWKSYALYSLQKGARVAVGDVDGDGRLDVVTTGEHGCIVALQSPDTRGDFLPSYALSTEACGGLSLGDFNRDGLLDVCCVEVATGTLMVITGDPDFDLLRICSLNGLPPGVPYEFMHVAAGDVNGDGRLDVVTVCPTGMGAPDSRLMEFGDSP